MRPFSFGGGGWGRGSHQRLWRRLDHAAGQINPYLMVIAIGLAILDATCLVGLIDTSRVMRRPDPGAAISAPTMPTVPD